LDLVKNISSFKTSNLFDKSENGFFSPLIGEHLSLWLYD
jgi:hypothetical protein